MVFLVITNYHVQSMLYRTFENTGCQKIFLERSLLLILLLTTSQTDEFSRCDEYGNWSNKRCFYNLVANSNELPFPLPYY